MSFIHNEKDFMLTIMNTKYLEKITINQTDHAPCKTRSFLGNATYFGSLQVHRPYIINHTLKGTYTHNLKTGPIPVWPKFSNRSNCSKNLNWF